MIKFFVKNGLCGKNEKENFLKEKFIIVKINTSIYKFN